jgi:hypothetical protein
VRRVAVEDDGRTAWVTIAAAADLAPAVDHCVRLLNLTRSTPKSRVAIGGPAADRLLGTGSWNEHRRASYMQSLRLPMWCSRFASEFGQADLSAPSPVRATVRA